MSVVAELSASERVALAEWIGERPETVLPVAALSAGAARAWVLGPAPDPHAALVESPLVPSEPQGFGSAEALLELLRFADGWACVEVDPLTAADLEEGFHERWGLARTVIDVVHRLDRPVMVRPHPLVRALTPDDVQRLPTASNDLLPSDRTMVAAAAANGRLFGAVASGVIVGQGSSMASASWFGDVGVHVADHLRRRGIATAAASAACAALQDAGLTPVWGAGSLNHASLGVAAKLGFVEVCRRTYLVRNRP